MPLPKVLTVLIVLAIILFLAMTWGSYGSGRDMYQEAASVPAENQGEVSDEERAAIDSARYEPASANDEM